jgi:hypothetical protein
MHLAIAAKCQNLRPKGYCHKKYTRIVLRASLTGEKEEFNEREVRDRWQSAVHGEGTD